MIVRVKWIDAVSLAGWWAQADACKVIGKGKIIKTVGHVIKRNKKGITLAQGVADDGDVHEAFFIPKGMILKIKGYK